LTLTPRTQAKLESPLLKLLIAGLGDSLMLADGNEVAGVWTSKVLLCCWAWWHMVVIPAIGRLR
jgi:hypothetical protein